MEEDLGCEESIVFVEIAIVKYKEEFNAVIQGLDGMRDSTEKN